MLIHLWWERDGRQLGLEASKGESSSERAELRALVFFVCNPQRKKKTTATATPLLPLSLGVSPVLFFPA